MMLKELLEEAEQENRELLRHTYQAYHEEGFDYLEIYPGSEDIEQEFFELGRKLDARSISRVNEGEYFRLSVKR